MAVKPFDTHYYYRTHKTHEVLHITVVISISSALHVTIYFVTGNLWITGLRFCAAPVAFELIPEHSFDMADEGFHMPSSSSMEVSE